MSDTILLQKKILFHMTRYTNVYEIIVKHNITDKHFAENFRMLFRLLVSFYTAYNAVPTSEEVGFALQNSKYPQGSKDNALGVYYEVGNLQDTSSFEFLLTCLIEETRKQTIRDTLIKAVNRVEAQDIDEAIKVMETGLSSLKVVSSEAMLDLNVEASVEYQNYINSLGILDVGNVFTGFPTLDRTTGGIQLGELWVILGWMKSGKSILMLNMAYNAWAMGKNVLYLSGELRRTPLKRRVYSRGSGLIYDNIKFKRLTESEQVVYKDFLDKFHSAPNSLVIQCEPGLSTTSVEYRIKELQKTRPVDLVICDYLKVMTPKDRGHSRNEKIGNTALELREIAGKLNIPIITANQINKEGYKESKKNDVGMEHSGDSIDIPQHADLVLPMMIIDREQKKQMKVRWETKIEIAGSRDSSDCYFECDVFSDRMLMVEKGV